MPNIPYSGGSYEKSAFVRSRGGISNVTALPTADAADTDSGKAARSYAADYSRERGAYARVGAYPYYRGFDRVADPWWPGSGFCAYGS